MSKLKVYVDFVSAEKEVVEDHTASLTNLEALKFRRAYKAIEKESSKIMNRYHKESKAQIQFEKLNIDIPCLDT